MCLVKINQNNSSNINAFQQSPTFSNESLFQTSHARLTAVLQLLRCFAGLFFLSIFSGEIKELLENSSNKRKGFHNFLWKTFNSKFGALMIFT